MGQETDCERKRKIRVLQVTLSLDVGGAERLVCDLVRRLDPACFDSSVCCLRSLGALGEQLRDADYTVHLLDAGGSRLKTIRMLRRIVQQERIDVLHAHTYTPFFFSAISKCFLGDVRLVFTDHGRLYPERDNPKRQIVNPVLARLADEIVSISASNKAAMVGHDNFPQNAVRVIWNGVPLAAEDPGQVSVARRRSELGLGPDGGLVGMAARLVSLKNFPMALRAMRLVVRALPSAMLLIAGDGPEMQHLQRLAGELGLENNIRFLGMRDDLAQLYPLFDVYVISSLTEGISLTLLEAMERGVPAVATDVGGNPEVIVEGETGYLVRSDDAAALARRIVELLRSPRKREEMGRRSRSRVIRTFSMERMVDRYAALYCGSRARAAERSSAAPDVTDRCVES